MKLAFLFIFIILIITTIGENCNKNDIKCCSNFTNTNECISIIKECPLGYSKC